MYGLIKELSYRAWADRPTYRIINAVSFDQPRLCQSARIGIRKYSRLVSLLQIHTEYGVSNLRRTNAKLSNAKYMHIT